MSLNYGCGAIAVYDQSGKEVSLAVDETESIGVAALYAESRA